MTRYYSRYDLIREALDRLSLLHSSDFRIISGKNKLTFELNGEYFEVLKSIDKTMNKCKTIVEGCDNNMIPIILYQSDSDLFTDRDVEEMVCGLDHYFIHERIKEKPSLAVCNKYNYLSDLLSKHGYDLETLMGEAAQSTSSNSEDNTIFLTFKAVSVSRDYSIIVFFVLEDYQVRILKFTYDESESLDLDDNNFINELIIEYEDNDPEEITSAVSHFLTGYESLIPYKGIFTYLEEEKTDA